MNMKFVKFLPLVLLLVCDAALAQKTGMPYESVLEEIKKSLSGPVAQAVALIGIIGSGCMLIWGGEISGFLKSIIYVVLVVSLIIGANTLLGKFSSNGDGAEIAFEPVPAHVIVLDSGLRS